jgi:hypothetical protein
VRPQRRRQQQFRGKIRLNFLPQPARLLNLHRLTRQVQKPGKFRSKLTESRMKARYNFAFAAVVVELVDTLS